MSSSRSCRGARGVVYGLVALIALLVRPSVGLEMEQLWVANPDMVMEGAPVVVDLDGDGDDEVVVAAKEAVIAVDGAGRELWRVDTGGRHYSACPAILEREGELPLIYVGNGGNTLTCLDGRGAIQWQRPGLGYITSSPALADVNADGAVEVIQGDQSQKLAAFDALTGEIVWETQVDGMCSGPAVADMNGDRQLETVISTSTGKVYALDATGEVVWEFDMGGHARYWEISCPVLFQSSMGQTRVAVASGDERFYCLDNQGNLLWEKPTRGSVASGTSIGDFDADGRADIFVVTQLGILYRFDEDGRVLWDIDTQGRSLASGAIVDIDGDAALEYVLCTQQGNLLVLSNAGEVVFDHQFDNRTINVTPAFGDIVSERPGLELAVTGGESGLVFCLGTPAPVDASAEWRTYRGDNRMTGAWLGQDASDEVRMTPENLGWDQILTGGDVAFRIADPNPGDEPLRAEAVCVRPDGSRQAAVGKVVGSRGLLQMPVSITTPGVYCFEWELKGPSGNRLLNGSRELTLRPYANDQALATRAVVALREAMAGAKVAEGDGGLDAAMYRESQGIEEEAAALGFLQAGVPGSSPAFRERLDARTVALNARAKRGLALAEAAGPILASGSNSPIVAFEGVTWENRDVDTQLPSVAAFPLRIERRCVPGEHEPVSVKLLNVTLGEVSVGCAANVDPAATKVTAFEVKPVPTNLNTVAWDPIVPLGSGVLTIPSLETREIWLDIDLTDATPGPHSVDVVLTSGATETRVEIELDVLPFEMAGFGAMRMCNWASYNDETVRDLLAHGNNVFTVGLPPATVTEGGTPGIELDFTDLDAFTARLSGHDVFLLMGGIPSLGVPMEDDAYAPRLADFLNQLVTHLEASGIPEDNFALYPYDEPGGHGWSTVNHYVAFGRQGLKARPNLKFYVNGGGDLAMFEALNEVASIWCPGYAMLSEDSPEMDFLRESGKTIWSYDCGYSYARPIGANTKTINVVAQYRMPAVFGLSYGATGVGYWCYNVGPSMWEPIKDEYPHVYANPDGSHTSSRRWEAIRESMEDARILIALRDRLSDESVDAEARAKIRHLLNETVTGLASQSLGEMRLGVARYVLDASSNDDTVERFRAEMLDCAALVAE